MACLARLPLSARHSVVLLVLFPALEDMARPILLIAVIASVFVAGVVIVQSGTVHA